MKLELDVETQRVLMRIASDNVQLADNASSVQARCTELTEELRAVKAERDEVASRYHELEARVALLQAHRTEPAPPMAMSTPWEPLGPHSAMDPWETQKAFGPPFRGIDETNADFEHRMRYGADAEPDPRGPVAVIGAAP